MSRELSLIGVFDSGVGGLTVVKELQKAIPGVDIVYLGDTARVPYGSKSKETVERYALSCMAFLKSKGAEMVLVACNTASANALPALESQEDIPVIGAVKPGAMAAARMTGSNQIAVIGTLSTIESGAYTKELKSINSEIQVYSKACPLLVPLVEEGWLNHHITLDVAKTYLAPIFEKHPDIDCLVLGCTHYPLLKSTIQKALSELGVGAVNVVDSAATMAELTQKISKPSPSKSQGQLEIYVTDSTRIQSVGAQFLGKALEHFELVDLQTTTA